MRESLTWQGVSACGTNCRMQTLKTSLDSRGVFTVELNRPDIRNAFNEQMLDDLIDAFGKDAARPEVRVVVLRGAGAVFSAGGDLSWMKKSVEKSLEQNLEETRKVTRVFKTINELQKPVIGLIQGAALGGGVGLVSVCDIAIAADDAVFSLSEVRLGIVPACIGPFVVSKIGASHARALFISAERFRAQRALEIGLVHAVVAERELQGECDRMLENMLQCGPKAMGIAKTLVLDLAWPERRQAKGDPFEMVSRCLAEVRVSPEGQEGLKAFLEKRKPSWIR